MLICEICGLASHLDSCPTCGVSHNDKLRSGGEDEYIENLSKDVELPFDLQTPSVNVSDVPAFGLDDSPTPHLPKVSQGDSVCPIPFSFATTNGISFDFYSSPY